MNEIVLNWHITEECNYKCYFCFAKYEKLATKEIHTNTEDITTLLTKLKRALEIRYAGRTLRLNIAGGEPLLSQNLGFIIESARKLGFQVSLISNASLLTSGFITRFVPLLSMFGISVDSISLATNKKIGRYNKCHNNAIDQREIFIQELRGANANLHIKINTVVNHCNYKEDMSAFIESVRPQKWKIFQALSIHTKQNYCTDEEFRHFLTTHKHLQRYIVDENKNLMTNSYIMLDPFGRFYQNASHAKNGGGGVIHTALHFLAYRLKKLQSAFKWI